MKSIIAKKNFNLDGKFYNIGDEVKPKDRETLIRLNEKGFIEPLTAKQVQEFGKEQPKIEKKIFKKEEDE